MPPTPLPSLLLLPFPPQPPSHASLNAAYRPPLTAALSRLADPRRSVVLIVAVVCPILSGSSPRTKSLSWTNAQSLLAGIYSLVSVICAQESIATDVNGGPGSVDTRVVLVDHDRARRFSSDFVAGIEPNNTIVVDLPTFVSAYHPWAFIFHVNSEPGYQTLSNYLKFAEGKQALLQQQLVAVEGGVSLYTEPPSSDATGTIALTYPNVCLGGTFDHLHPGHKLLLTAAVLLLAVPRKDSASSCRLIIGITGDELLKNKKYAEFVQSWDDRARSVLDFLASLLELRGTGWKGDPRPTIQERPGDFKATFRDGTISIHCVQIQDAFGPTITDEHIDALVVSGETRSGGKAVNDKRSEQGWDTLEVYEVDVLDAEEMTDEGTKTVNFAAKISSTAIRQQKAESGATA